MMCVAAGSLTFEKRLGALNVDDTSPSAQWAQRMLEANWRMFVISALLKFSLPFYQIFATPLWNEIVKTEDYFYGLVN
jgi:hypothetical protein